MKTKFFRIIMVLGIIMMLACFISCSESEGASEEVVLNSEVLEQGSDETVIVTENGTDGTTLTYDTWIRVYRETTEGSTPVEGEVVKATLTNAIKDAKEVITGNDSGTRTRADVESQITYEISGEPIQRSQYVTVQDSVLVYTKLVEGIPVSHRLMYQVATYDDSKTKQVMPYYVYENIVDQGEELSVFQETFDGSVYRISTCVSTITTEFNGETYTSVSTVEKREPLVDYLVTSRVIDEGKELLTQDSKNTLSGTSRSWIKVEQEWSQSGIKTFIAEAALNNRMNVSDKVYSLVMPEKYYATFQFSVEFQEPAPENNGKRQVGSVNVVEKRQDYSTLVGASATNDRFFDLYMSYYYEVPTYSDEKLTYEMPHYVPTSSGYGIGFAGEDWSEQNGTWYRPMTSTIKVNFGLERVSDEVLWIGEFREHLEYSE